jgi:hypothetical protein
MTAAWASRAAILSTPQVVSWPPVFIRSFFDTSFAMQGVCGWSQIFDCEGSARGRSLLIRSHGRVGGGPGDEFEGLQSLFAGRDPSLNEVDKEVGAGAAELVGLEVDGGDAGGGQFHRGAVDA